MTRRIAIIVLLALSLTPLTTPAEAGFFDMLFGGFRRHAPSAPSLPQINPVPSMPAPMTPGSDYQVRAPSSGPRSAFCVRTCDGHYFPVQASAGMSAAQMCSSFCPAAETRLYSGGGIDYAVGMDGKPYRALPQAYAYRKKLVDGCTCNGKDAFGLARIDVRDDPTLARGDIVVTPKGLAAVSGRDAQGAQLTPVASYRGLSEREREKLGETKVARPRNAPPETTGAGPAED